MLYKGIVKAVEDACGVVHDEAFWVIKNIDCVITGSQYTDMGGGFKRVIRVHFLSWHSQAAFDAGDKSPLVNTQMISITELEQFPAIASFEALVSYAYTVAKYHPTQTFFNDGTLVELNESSSSESSESSAPVAP